MKVFISWSGNLSFEIAKLLKRWLKCVLQSTDPWISSEDIEKGSIWFNEISNTLDDCNTGIVCLTKENINSAWILFEAGNLLKGLDSNRVCTFLVDLEPKDIEPPLSQLNHTGPDKDSVFKLISTLNSRLIDGKLEMDILTTVFNTYWPQFETDFNNILAEKREDYQSTPIRSERDILTEILYSVRSLENKIKNLEDHILFESDTFESDAFNSNKSNDRSSLFKVYHPSFGEGTVFKIIPFNNDHLLTVDFGEMGTKQILQNIATKKGMKKLD